MQLGNITPNSVIYRVVFGCILTNENPAEEYFLDFAEAVERYEESNAKHPTANGAAPFCTLYVNPIGRTKYENTDKG